MTIRKKSAHPPVAPVAPVTPPVVVAPPVAPVPAGPVYKKTVDGFDIVDSGYSRSEASFMADCTTALWCPETHQPVRVEVQYTGKARGTAARGLTKIRVGKRIYTEMRNGDRYPMFDSKAAQEIPLHQPVMVFSAAGFQPGSYIEANYEMAIDTRVDVYLAARRLPT